MSVTATDIANRACQKVGAPLIASGALLTEDSQSAVQIRACYDLLRRAELRRNVWRFSVRTTAVRAVDLDSKLITFATYAAGTTYAINDIVVGDDGQIYYSLIASNTGNTPSSSPTKWQLYFGPDMCSEYVRTWSSTVTYAKGDSTEGSDGSFYTSLVDSNTNNNPVGDGGVHWKDATSTTKATATSFYAGELVHIGGFVYLSLNNSNTDDPITNTNSYWLKLTAQPTIALLNLIYPIGTSPLSADDTLLNVYRLPVGYMRIAPQDPKAGLVTILGAPTGTQFLDWVFAGNYFISSDEGPIPLRFAADIQDTTQFDPMFVEGLACRIGIEVCEVLTQSSQKVARCEAQYKVFMGEARIVNGIEEGPTAPPEDDYITTRY